MVTRGKLGPGAVACYRRSVLMLLFRRSRFVPLVPVMRQLGTMVVSWTRYPLLPVDGTRDECRNR